MAEKIFTNVRLGLKVDTLEKWNASSLVLKRGEIAFATTAASVGTGLTEPVCMMKIGDGEHVFKDLEWNFYAKASDVLAACKSEAALKTFINGVIADAGIATNEAMEALAGRVTTTEGKVTTLEGKMTAVEGKAAANEGAIAALQELVGDETVAKKISDAIAALDLANTYDAKGAAASAETAAKTYADGLNTAMNTRVEALEAIDHTHANKAELDKIAEGDKAKWDAMEQNAKDYADGLNTAMDTRMDAIEAKFGDGEGNVESQIAAAVAAEKQEREAADTGLGNRIKAVEDDYLKAADKTELAGDIKDNADAIEALQEQVGDEPVADQISKAVADEAEIARAAEKANADAIKAISDDYLKAADKTELQGAIEAAEESAVDRVLGYLAEDVVNEKYDTLKEVAAWIESDTTASAQLVTRVSDIEKDYLKAADKNELSGLIGGLDTRMGAAETAIGTKAAQADHEALAGRVTTAEGKITTLEGEMDTAQADILALQGLVGDETVTKKISDAIKALEDGQLTTMQGEIDAVEGRVDTLEGAKHTHDNKTVLDGIEAADVTAWDAKVDSVAAGEGLKATREGNAVTIAFDEELVWIFDCGDSTTV